MSIVVLGASGFIGQHLLSSLRGGAMGLSLRDRAWRSEVTKADVVINLVGKAHDHKGTADEQDYYFANVELAKQVYSAFVESSARLLIHISSLAAVEEFESHVPLTEDHVCHPLSW